MTALADLPAFRTAIREFYLTNPVARASKLMGELAGMAARLKAAGIPENASRPPHPRHRFDSKSDIIRALRARLDAGQPVDLTSMNRPRSQGGDTSLVNYAREYYRSWGEAVRDAHAGA